MKKNIHPKQRKVKIKIGTDEIETISCYSKGDEIIADIDFRKHPAWTGASALGASSTDANVASFNKKYGDIF